MLVRDHVAALLGLEPAGATEVVLASARARALMSESAAALDARRRASRNT